MPPTITPQEFVAKWRQATLKERNAAQEHFIDLCRLIGHPTPAEDDPTGERFTFEAGAGKQKGGQGWADVWKRGASPFSECYTHVFMKPGHWQLLRDRVLGTIQRTMRKVASKPSPTPGPPARSPKMIRASR